MTAVQTEILDKISSMTVLEALGAHQGDGR